MTKTPNSEEMERRCKGTTIAGQPCKGRAILPSGFCVAHDQSRIVEMATWRRAGGRGKASAARAAKALPQAMDSAILRRHLSGVLLAVIDGTVPPNVGTASSSICKALIELQRVDEIEVRLELIEKRLGDKRHGWH